MMFADGLKLYLHFPSKPALPVSQEFHQSINTLSSTTNSWSLKFAISKCVHLRFSYVFDTEAVESYLLDGNVIRLLLFHYNLGITNIIQLRFHHCIWAFVFGAGGIATSLLKYIMA